MRMLHGSRSRGATNSCAGRIRYVHGPQTPTIWLPPPSIVRSRGWPGERQALVFPGVVGAGKDELRDTEARQMPTVGLLAL